MAGSKTGSKDGSKKIARPIARKIARIDSKELSEQITADYADIARHQQSSAKNFQPSLFWLLLIP
jgi:hypothetical protein